MTTINKTFRFRIYPNKTQKELITKTIGCSRFVFNHFLNKWNEAFKTTNKGLTYNTCSAQLTQLKKELLWLKEVDSISLQSSLKNLDDAFKRFFKKQNQAPRFKSKRNPVQSYTTRHTNGNIAVIDNRIKLPKLGLVKFAKSKEVDGRILNATIKCKPSGKYYISILTQTEVQELPKTNSSVGTDLGLKDFAILSNGKVYENPNFFRSLEKKLAKEQAILSRRTKGGSNWKKQRVKVARIHEHIQNARRDYLHKISTEIVKNHDIIGIEDLQVSDMLKNKKFSKGISEVSWSEFRTMLEYKSSWYGKKVIVVAKNFPSSQLCSDCNYKNKDVKDLSLRKWTCPKCNSKHDRDINASINLKNEALRLLTVGTTGLA